jgi:hypothetical protein
MPPIDPNPSPVPDAPLNPSTPPAPPPPPTPGGGSFSSTLPGTTVTPSTPVSTGPPPPPQPANVAPNPSPPSGQVISGGFNPAAASLPGASPGQPTVSAQPQGMVVGSTELFAPDAPAQASTKKRSFKPFLIALTAILVVGIGSAAAYFGVVVPNKPANVLRTALLNSVQETQASASGSFKDGTGSFKGTFSTAADTAAKAADFKLSVTYSGVTFPVEGRLVQQNFYFKFGDLSTISSILGSFSPDAGTTAQSLSQQVSNKWIVVDSTLMNQDPTVKCLLGLKWALTPADIKLLQTQYKNHPFTTIQSASSGTVEGKSAEKFVLNISDDGFSKFGNSLQNLSIAKAGKKCPGVSSSPEMRLTAAKTSTKTTPITVWVDKHSKHIVQIAASSKDGSEIVTIHYGHVSITAPPNATPVLQFLSTLQSSLGSSGTDFSKFLNQSSSGNTN